MTSYSVPRQFPPDSFGRVIGFLGMSTSVVAIVLLHCVSGRRIDPLSTTLSNYVFVPGYGWLFPTTALGMAVAGFAVLFALRRSGMVTGFLLPLTVLVASVGCVLVAAFATVRHGPLTLSAQIHRYSAGVAFCCVPIAAVLLAGRLRATRPASRHTRWLRCSAAASTLILTLFLTSHLGLMPAAVQQLRGLFQRIQLAVQLVTLSQLLLAISAPRVGHPCRRDVPARGHLGNVGGQHAGHQRPCEQPGATVTLR